jgi:four helix bundle protein
LADELVIEVYKGTKLFPKEEIYGLTSQMRRAAVSVAANIVEGSSRKHKRDYLHFLYIARGSLAEVDYLISLSCKLGYLNKAEFEKIHMLLHETAKTLHGLIISVEKET